MGNLLYYRYMNPAIVAPDAFDIIELSAGGQLTTDQRRNLGSIAKLLQHAASNKMFQGDNAHLNPINEYLTNSYQKFRCVCVCVCVRLRVCACACARARVCVCALHHSEARGSLHCCHVVSNQTSVPVVSSTTDVSSWPPVTSLRWKTSSTWINTQTWSTSKNQSSISPSERSSTHTQ